MIKQAPQRLQRAIGRLRASGAPGALPGLFQRPLPGLAIAWVAAVAIVAWLVLDGRNVALLRGERGTAAFATVVEHQTVITFRSLALTLAAIGDAHALAHPPPHDPDFQQMMGRRLKDVPFVRAIFVIGPDGWLIHDTDHPETPNVSLADRPYFRAHAQDPSIQSAAWTPLLSRSGTGWFLPVTHALGRSGAFSGIVVAAIQADHFSAELRKIGLTERYSVALFHRDGTLVAADPPRPEDVGKQFRLPSTPNAHPGAVQTAVWSDAGDGLFAGDRVASYRAVENAPFIVLASRTRSDVLAEWRRTAAGAAFAMVALTAILGWFVVRVFREHAARERERHRRVQADKLEALGQLTAGIAHDFGNMLNVLAMSTDLLREEPADRSVIDQTLSNIDRTVNGGKALINRLLSFARQRPLALVPLRLDAWLEETRPLLAQAAGGRVTLSIEAIPPIPEVLCDSGQLDVALVNLIVNSRDAMAGAGRICIRVFRCDDAAGPVSTEPGAGFVCVAVQDNGPGMSAEVRRRALEPFYTTKGEAGTGLGLSQVYGLMRQLGGTMTLDSAPDGGTAVHLFFPVMTPAPPRG